AYAGLLGSEAVRCHRKYGASTLHALQIDLRDVQHYVEGNQAAVRRALAIIKSANERQQGDASWKGSLLFGKFKLWEGIAYFWLDKFDVAIRLLREARGVFIAHEGQEDLMFLAENWIGYTYYRKADFVEAETWMQITLEGLLTLLAKEVKAGERKKRNLHQRIQYAYGNLAMLYRYTGRFFESIRYAEAQHRIVKSLPRNKKEIFRSLNTLAHVLAVAGRSMDARSYLEQAKKIYKEIPDPLLGGRLLSNYCWLTHDALESAYMIEYYRAKELRYAVDRTYSKQSGLRAEQLGSSVEHTEDAVKILDGRAGTPIFYKELADAYSSWANCI
ncbi:MAG: tetratricopeptide repeat protein, partial [Candidatus Electrothrix sp. AR5]|nr:tetratricopeptide repeat protein [Candidatus Electrothrix sp. AR5]